MKRLYLILIYLSMVWIAVILTSCAGDSKEVNGDTSYYQEHSVNDVSVFLSVEENPFLGRPTAIKASQDGLYIIDSGRYKIHKVNSAGDLHLSFGNRGQGPGEYQLITGFWPLEDRYLVYDYNSFKFITYDQQGDMIDEVILRENPVNPESGRSIPITVEALTSEKLLIPTGGNWGSLFAIAELGSEEVIYAGNALGEFVAIYNHEEVTAAYSRGENPGIFKNLVMLGSSQEAIYSLQQTTGVLEKFTHSGERVWELELNIQGQEGLMDIIAQNNIEAGKRNGPTQMLMHARAMDASEEGVAMLLGIPVNQPTAVAWVPADGSGVDLITTDSLDLDDFGFMGMFALSVEDRTAYFLERETGNVFQFEWPL